MSKKRSKLHGRHICRRSGSIRRPQSRRSLAPGSGRIEPSDIRRDWVVLRVFNLSPSEAGSIPARAIPLSRRVCRRHPSPHGLHNDKMLPEWEGQLSFLGCTPYDPVSQMAETPAVQPDASGFESRQDHHEMIRGGVHGCGASWLLCHYPGRCALR